MTSVRKTLSEALDLQRAGEFADARELYLQVLAAEPEHADALNLLGVLSLQCQRYDDALSYLEQATIHDPKAGYFNNLGLVFKHLGKPDTAQRQFETALELEPDHLDAAINLAASWNESSRSDQAYSLLLDHRQQGAGHPVYLYNFATTCIKTGAFEQARKALEELLAITPDDAGALFNYAMLLKNKRDIAAAATVFAKLIDQPEKTAKARWFYSQCRLLGQDFNEGWKYYSARFEALNIAYRASDLPPWENDQAQAPELLIWAEQGIGDELLFATHIPLLKRACSTIYYECDTRLRPLLERTHGDIHFFDRQQNARINTDHLKAGLQCAAGDIVRFTNPELKPLAQESRILLVDQDRSAAFELPPTTGLNIGLSYHTGGSNAQYRMPPSDFWDLFGDFKGQVNLIDLQSNRHESFSPPGILLDQNLLQQIDGLDLYNDFDGLAALISRLDHVVSIDNAVAHLAGNLGVPTTLVLSTVHDWRWLLHQQTVPWYPMMRMLRQNREADWGDVKLQLHETIRQLVNSSS